MSITKESELLGMQKASEAVAYTLKAMINSTYAVELKGGWTMVGDKGGTWCNMSIRSLLPVEAYNTNGNERHI